MRIPTTRKPQPRLLDGDKREYRFAAIPPVLMAMAQMDADTSGIFVSWIIADALASYYDMPHLSPFHIAAVRERAHRRKR